MKQYLANIIACALLAGACPPVDAALEAPPSTSAEMFQALKLIESQHTEFKALEQERKDAAAKFKELKGEALRSAQNNFYSERKKKLKKIFTEKQWAIWSGFWNRPRKATPPSPTPEPAMAPAVVPDLSETPIIDSADLDRFGGWKAKSFEATGFFRTHHDGSRWWLVTPEGHPFLSFGLNHFHAATWNAPYNSKHWIEQFGAQEPMDPKWMEGFRNETLRICRKLGITALGIHNDAPRLTNMPQGAILPYIRRFQPVELSHYTYPVADKYHDVFAAQFVIHCDEVARLAALPYKDDPMLIGYSMSDAPRLTDVSVRNRPPGATTWPRVLRNLGPEAPGKQAYVQILKERHNNISAFNKAYGASFESWQSLADAGNWRPRTDYSNETELEDNAAFLNLCIDQCYTVAKASLLKVDPNHMFLGDKLGARGSNFDAVIEVAAHHMDVINYGHYGRLTEQAAVLDRWTEKLNKPFLSADGSFSVPGEMLPNPMGTPAEDWDECSAWTRELAAGLFARPDVVGWNICGVMETWKTARGGQKTQHQGIMDPFGKFNPGMESAIRDVTSRIYHIADSQSTEAKGASSRSGNKDEYPDIIGRKGFVHAERIDGIWFMVNAEGERFVPTGMNHVGPMHRFASYNREFWMKEFGSEVFKNGRVDFNGPGAKRWLERIAKDHKEYGFNTLAFHHPLTMPTEYCNELEFYYFGKMKFSHVHARRAKTMGPNGKLPDVFDPAWLAKLDAFVERYTARHKDAKYLLGHSYDDLPAYTIHHLEKRITKFERHPWVIDIISKPGLTRGKQAWIDILKEQYANAREAGSMYGLAVSAWDDFGEVTEWGLPRDSGQGFADQEKMNMRIVEAYLKANHDALRKHDPNHLIFGDKIQNARPQPDWVWKIVKKYVDVILIQDYDFFHPGHEKKLRHIHSLTGKPIINGDHSYGVLRPNMTAVKGVKVPSAKAKGQQYAVYLRGIMNLPFMVGWQTCGYMETWTGAADATGKQQTGYFDPFGKPIKEALAHAMAANKQALQWHEKAGSLKNIYSDKRK